MTTKSRLLAGALGAATAVVSIPALAVDASGNVYGDLRASVDYSSVEGVLADALKTGDDTDFRDLNSYIGVKGETTAGGVTAFGAYEMYVDQSVSVLGLTTTPPRQVYAGIKGSFGTVSYGEMFTAYAKAGLSVDPFYNTALANGLGGRAGSQFSNLSSGGIALFPEAGMYSSFGLSPFLTADSPVKMEANGVLVPVITPERVGGVKGNQLAYESPQFGGFTVNAAVFFDDNDNGGPDAPFLTGEEAHDYALGVAFASGAFKAGVQAIQANDETGAPTFNPNFVGAGTDSVATRVHGAYVTPSYGLGLSAERIDDKSNGTSDAKHVFLSGWSSVASGTRVAAAVGLNRDVVNPLGPLFPAPAGADGLGIQLAVFHDIVPSFTVHAGVTKIDIKRNSELIAAGGVDADNSEIIAIGASYKFDLGFGGGTVAK